MSTARKRTPKRRTRPASVVRRLDGLGAWPIVIDQYISMLLTAGVTPDAIVAAVGTSLKRHRHAPVIQLPPLEVLEYSRIITVWRHDPEFADDHGRPAALKIGGRSPSFTALVKVALPEAKPTDVLKVLLRHQLISRGPNRRLHMLSDSFLPRGTERAQILAYTLANVQAVMGTCHGNLNADDASIDLNLFQRMAYAERFDLTHLPAYRKFLADSAQDFLLKHDAWLKKRELPAGKKNKKTPIGYVGVSVSGFKPR